MTEGPKQSQPLLSFDRFKKRSSINNDGILESSLESPVPTNGKRYDQFRRWAGVIVVSFTLKRKFKMLTYYYKSRSQF